MLFSQDDVRMRMLYVENKKDNPAIELLYRLAMYGNEIGANVILEGVLANNKYSEMLHKLVANFSGNITAYYLDIPFEETVKRHATRVKKDDFGEEELRSWWKEKDYLGIPSEQILDATLSEDQIVEMICRNMSRS